MSEDQFADMIEQFAMQQWRIGASGEFALRNWQGLAQTIRINAKENADRPSLSIRPELEA